MFSLKGGNGLASVPAVALIEKVKRACEVVFQIPASSGLAFPPCGQEKPFFEIKTKIEGSLRKLTAQCPVNILANRAKNFLMGRRFLLGLP